MADDATAVGKLEFLKMWWDTIVAEGLKYGYHVHAGKSCLILKKQDDYQKAVTIFNESVINMELTGKRHLGAVIGSNDFKECVLRDTLMNLLF